MTTRVERFWDWLEAEMREQGFESYRAVERAGEVSNGTISGRARQRMPPTATTLQAVSRALNLPFDFVARQTSSQPQPPIKAAQRREADHLFGQMTDEDQEVILVQMRAIVRERRVRREAGSQPS